jgi:hypothetical protein
MKRLILITLITTLYVNVKAQALAIDTIPKVDGNYEYSEVVNINALKTQLYKTAKNFFVDYYNDANSVIKYQDEIEGKIIGRGSFQLTATANMGVRVDWNVIYTLEIICKDNKYKYRIYDIQVEDSNYGADNTAYTTPSNLDEIKYKIHHGYFKKQHTKLYTGLNEKFYIDETDIKNYISKKINDNKSDNF